MRNGYWFNREVVNKYMEGTLLSYPFFDFFTTYTDALNGYVYHRSENKGLYKQNIFTFLLLLCTFKVFNGLIQHSVVYSLNNM